MNSLDMKHHALSRGAFRLGNLSGAKFGDIIENGYASPNNPKRFGIFVSYDKDCVKLISSKYQQWSVFNNPESLFLIRGNVFEERNKMSRSIKSITKYLTNI